MDFSKPIVAVLFLSLLIAGMASCVPDGTDRISNQPAIADTLLIGRWKRVDSAIALVHSGDLVMRADADYESLSLQNFSQRDKQFSHSGLVFREGNAWMVYHSLAGDENPSGLLRKDSLEHFFNPARKIAIGVFRYAIDTSEISKLHQYLVDQYAQKLPFDKHFSLASTDSMYCSELIYRALRNVTKDRIQLHVSEITNFHSKRFRQNNKPVFFKKFQFIGLDDLYLHPACTPITRIAFP